jgi:hypothetical protein
VLRLPWSLRTVLVTLLILIATTVNAWLTREEPAVVWDPEWGVEPENPGILSDGMNGPADCGTVVPYG